MYNMIIQVWIKYLVAKLILEEVDTDNLLLGFLIVALLTILLLRGTTALSIDILTILGFDITIQFGLLDLLFWNILLFIFLAIR